MSLPRPLNLLFLGPPGAGKGTQAKRLAATRGLPHISTGDILRAADRAGTPLGIEARSFMSRGELVPDAVMCPLVDARLQEPDCVPGFILDGFPRTIVQARSLDSALRARGLGILACIVFDLDPEVVVSRMAGRLTCSCGRMFNIDSAPPKQPGVCDGCGGRLFQRADDVPEAVRRRLRVYEEATRGLIEHYRGAGHLVTLDASAPVETVAAAFAAALLRY